MPMIDENISTETHNWPNRVRRSSASDYVLKEHGVKIAPATLAKLAVLGGGPEYELWGRIPYYPIKKLDEWVVGRLARRRSTSDCSSERTCV